MPKVSEANIVVVFGILVNDGRNFCEGGSSYRKSYHLQLTNTARLISIPHHFNL